MTITIARIIEAWRDARIFEFPIEPRGKLWHMLKYPQFGLLIASSATYFFVLHFGFQLFGWWVWNALATVAVIGIDIGFAYVVFEFFLPYFRERMRPKEKAN